jgi:hypothetical protein
VRVAAFDAIRTVGDGDCADCVRVALDDANRHVRAAACRALGVIGHDGDAGALAAALDDNDMGVQIAAARGLATMQNLAAAAVAVSQLTRIEPEPMRGRSLQKVRWLLRAVEPSDPTPELISTLSAFLRHAEGVRSEAARVIGRLRVEACRGSLEEALEAGTTKLKLHAASALISLGAQPSAGAIRPLLDDPDERVRVRACLALAEADDTAVARRIYELATSDTVGVRIAALRAFGRIMPQHAFEAWTDALSDDDARVRVLAAAHIAEELPDESARDALRAAAEKEAVPEVQGTLESFLGQPAHGDVCIHDLMVGTCSLCRTVTIRPAPVHHRATGDGWDGTVPDLVYVSPGGRTFHRRSDCEWLWKGLDHAAHGRGGAQSPVFLVPVEEAAYARRTTLCQTCFPDPDIVSSFGRLGGGDDRR